MMKKILIIAVVLVWIGAIAWATDFYISGNEAPPTPTPTPTPSIEPDFENTTGLPLKLPPDFSISIFAKDLPGVRVMAFGPRGNLWVSRTKEGVISLLGIKDGEVINSQDVYKNLNQPHGLVFDPEDPSILYYAEEDKISKIRVYSDEKSVKLADLPSGEGHFVRGLIVGPDDRLYVSVGSSCNVCEEEDSDRASILVIDKDGGRLREFASGLRNSAFMALNPTTNEILSTELSRVLGDGIVPDEINIIEEGNDYGWPDCYGQNILDKNFRDEEQYYCSDETEVPSFIDIEAQSSPLGLAFILNEAWPEDYQNDLLVAYHGSLNPEIPTGYKIVRMKLDKRGNFEGEEDFISGWIIDGKVLGAPVDVLIKENGEMYVSDDAKGVIYKVVYLK